MLDNDDARLNLELVVDQTFAIELIAETSAGYEWMPLIEPAAISYLGQKAIALVDYGGAGLQMLRRLTFRALATGEHRFILLYKRRWERAVRKRLTVSVRVADAI